MCQCLSFIDSFFRNLIKYHMVQTLKSFLEQLMRTCDVNPKIGSIPISVSFKPQVLYFMSMYIRTIYFSKKNLTHVILKTSLIFIVIFFFSLKNLFSVHSMKISLIMLLAHLYACKYNTFYLI